MFIFYQACTHMWMLSHKLDRKYLYFALLCKEDERNIISVFTSSFVMEFFVALKCNIPSIFWNLSSHSMDDARFEHI